MAEASSSPIVANSSGSSKRLKEDIDVARAKLSDQNFSMSRYADPLVPRSPANSQFWPRDVTQEMEKRWLAMIKEHRSA